MSTRYSIGLSSENGIQSLETLVGYQLTCHLSVRVLLNTISGRSLYITRYMSNVFPCTPTLYIQYVINLLFVIKLVSIINVKL